VFALMTTFCTTAFKTFAHENEVSHVYEKPLKEVDINSIWVSVTENNNNSILGSLKNSSQQPSAGRQASEQK
jgi:hypothetical protein